MDSHWIYCSAVFHLVIVSIIADQILTLEVPQDERVRLECTLSTKSDAEKAMWMRIRAPYNPDILTYRDSVVHAADHFQLEQRRLSSSLTSNGTFVDTYFSVLTILRPTVDDEGRYICARDREVFAEYDLFIIIPPHFVDDQSYVQHQIVVEGSILKLSCSASARPRPAITWYYRTKAGKNIQISDKRGCFDTVCELHLGNYTRHDPSVIECVADNGKSTRISRIFHIDVQYPPKLTTDVRALTGIRGIDLSLRCSVSANPPASIIWLDDNENEIIHQHQYNIQYDNQTSVLSFTVYPLTHSKVLYFCRSNNSIGTVEKLINIAEFVRFELTEPPRTSTTTGVTINSTARKKKTTQKNSRPRSRVTTSTVVTNSMTLSSQTARPSFNRFVLSLILFTIK